MDERKRGRRDEGKDWCNFVIINEKANIQAEIAALGWNFTFTVSGILLNCTSILYPCIGQLVQHWTGIPDCVK